MSHVSERRSFRFDSVDQFTLLVPPAAVVLLAVVWSAGITVAERYRWIPLIASVVVFGLPHGAIDHVALPRVRGEAPGARWAIVVGGLYLLLGTGYAIIWVLAPAVAVPSFLILTWFHWGQGDLYPLLSILDAGHLDTGIQRGMVIIVRGGLPMVVPLLAFPDRYRAVVELLLGLFGIPVAAVAVGFHPRVRGLLGVGFGIVTFVSIVVGFIRSRSRSDRISWLFDVGESALLWWYFWVVPPVVAVGVYFVFWHSVRHVGRVMTLDKVGCSLLPVIAGTRGKRSPVNSHNRPYDNGDGFAESLWEFFREAAPLSVVALVLGGGIAVLVPETPATIPDVGALYLVLLALLTLPHVVVVSWMDREQDLW